MKKTITITISTLVLSLTGGILGAQTTSPEVIASAGDFYTSAAASISWTAGETVVETFVGTNNILTQGFQQPENLYATVIQKSDILSGITTYPNPAYNILNLHFGNTVSGQVNIELFDVTGKKVYGETITASKDSTIKLDLTEFENGMYLLKVGNTNKGTPQIIKIQKTNQ